MKEVTGELWSYFNEPNHVVCITTNGACNSKGELVMGRGCAKEAKQMLPDIARVWGKMIKEHGNNCLNSIHYPNLYTFPTKHRWFEKSDIDLIVKSAEQLSHWASNRPDLTFVLPRPGCGNGGLKWERVKPVIESILPDNVLVISKT